MKGYKYLLNNMEAPFADGFFYELGKWYEVEDISKLEVYKYGYHYFDCTRDLLIYAYNESRNIYIYEIEADGKILYDNEDCKYCSSRIKIIKKLEKEDIYKLIEEEDLIHSDNMFIRAAVARRGYGLDILVNDENDYVREVVAAQGYGLDILVNDKSWFVRTAVAKQGYGLDKLVNDEHWQVRAEVAEQGYGLDKLINDEHWQVRVRVAQKGYGLDELINDESFGVSHCACLYRGGIES